jgi:hypothetical protein
MELSLLLESWWRQSKERALLGKSGKGDGRIVIFGSLLRRRFGGFGLQLGLARVGALLGKSGMSDG